MKKTTIIARADYHLDLQVQELSSILKVSKSTVIRMLITHSIRQIQDEKGNWKLPGRIYEQKEIGETGNQESSKDPFIELGGVKNNG